VLVPGRFCARRSPTASASDTLISSARVRARNAYSATVNSTGPGAAPSGSRPSATSISCHWAIICSALRRSVSSGTASSPSRARTVTCSPVRNAVTGGTSWVPTAAMQARRQCPGRSGDPSGSRANHSMVVPRMPRRAR
jgi:hypothetical protein